TLYAHHRSVASGCRPGRNVWKFMERAGSIAPFNMLEALEKQIGRDAQPSRLAVALGGVLGVGAVGVLDNVTPPEMALSILYLFPVGVTVWLAGRGLGFAIAVLAAVVWTFLEIHSRPYANPLMPYWNGAVRFGIFSIVAILIDTIRTLTHSLQELVRQRTAALEAEIKNRKEVERVVTEISAREQQRLGADLHDQLA